MTWQLLLPGLSAYINRFARGEGNWPKFLWLAFMALAGYLCSRDLGFTLIWLVFVAAYAIPPTHGMFSALSGNPPSRKDHPIFQWMQDIAMGLARGSWIEEQVDWHRFGIIYGAVRSFLILPAIISMAFYQQSLVPLIGFIFLGLGYLYYWSGKVCRKNGISGAAVALTEIITGWALMTWMLECL